MQDKRFMRQSGIVLFTMVLCIGCKKNDNVSNPAANLSANSIVTLTMHGEDIVLPSFVQAKFVEMVKLNPSHTDVGSARLPGKPLGLFSAGDMTFEWHGNGLRHMEKESLYEWSGECTQALVWLLYENKYPGLARSKQLIEGLTEVEFNALAAKAKDSHNKNGDHIGSP